MNQDLPQQAISAALKGDWKDARKINQSILKTNSSDIDALNRLAKAHAELGDITSAKKVASKVVKIDPFNKIALKSIDKWKRLKKSDIKGGSATDPSAFLEEPGKTKIVTLLHPGSTKVIAALDAGDEVNLNDHGHRMAIISGSNYLGRLPDDLSARLKKLMGYGNEYKVFVKSTNKREVKVLIREVTRAKELEDIPSFPSEKIDYISFTPPELVHDKSDKVDMGQDYEEE